jgi:hypothetical protein
VYSNKEMLNLDKSYFSSPLFLVDLWCTCATGHHQSPHPRRRVQTPTPPSPLLPHPVKKNSTCIPILAPVLRQKSTLAGKKGRTTWNFRFFPHPKRIFRPDRSESSTLGVGQVRCGSMNPTKNRR